MVAGLLSQTNRLATEQNGVVRFRHEEYNQEKLVSSVNVFLVWCVALPYLDSRPDDEYIKAPVLHQYTASCHESTVMDASAKRMNDIKSNMSGRAFSNDESTCRWCNNGWWVNHTYHRHEVFATMKPPIKGPTSGPLSMSACWVMVIDVGCTNR